jgi:O-antigen ligase
MTRKPSELCPSKSTGQRVLEYLILVLCLSAIALRTTVAEVPGGQASDQLINLPDQVYSLSISMVLIFSFLAWFVCSFCSRRFLYRLGRMELGLVLFVIAAVVSGLAAANKRAAITSSVTLLAPVLMAVLLVQILDSQAKIKLVLAVIAALGVVSTYQCAEQFFGGNQAMIEQYQQAPETFLEPIGIEPGTFAHMLFEHRLYSRGVRGFFTNSNSAGSFAFMASFAAIALFVDALGGRKSDRQGPRRLVSVGLAAALVLFGLALTASKGAIVAAVIAAVMFAAYLLFGDWLKQHKTTIVVCCLLVVVACGCVVVGYGVKHDRLPGGNSMLVRWQYWRASAQMFADHPLAGVGPGNFAHFYPKYKPAAALETIADPHCLPLSILTQYGPLGLIGLLAMILVPLWVVIFPTEVTSPPQSQRPISVFGAFTFVVVTSVVLLLVRPLLLTMPPGASPAERKAAAVILYVLPVIAFAVGFVLLTLGRVSSQTKSPSIVKAALFCAVVGILIHNLIDFAIFEPGVLTTLWAIIACLIAQDFQDRPHRQLIVSVPPFAKALCTIGILILAWACLVCAFVPVAKATGSIRRALREPEFADRLLDQAADYDRLDLVALDLNGRLHLHRYREQAAKQPALLKQAAQCFLAAADRNPVDYKNHERLTEVYTLLAQNSLGQERADCLNKAFDAAARAVELYPGSGRLRVNLAKLAEDLGKTKAAVEHYRKAIEIEKAYRRQFQVMYPGREIFSRLGEQKYQFARQRIEELTDRTIP